MSKKEEGQAKQDDGKYRDDNGCELHTDQEGLPLTQPYRQRAKEARMARPRTR